MVFYGRPATAQRWISAILICMTQKNCPYITDELLAMHGRLCWAPPPSSPSRGFNRIAKRRQSKHQHRAIIDFRGNVMRRLRTTSCATRRRDTDFVKRARSSDHAHS